MSRSRFTYGGGLALAVAALLAFASPVAAAPGDHPKLDKVLNARAKDHSSGHTRVIVVFNSSWDGSEAKKLGGRLGRRLNLIGAQVIELSNGQLKKLADHPSVRSIHFDRPVAGTMSRVAVTTGARGVQEMLGFTGAGVGVAVVDSGVAAWHDDLTYNGSSSLVRTSGGQRVAAFVDYVNGQSTPYDDNGHGTHVAGIVAGNGNDSRGAHAGMAPDAHLVALKVLDANGRGVISSVIGALEFAVANKNAYNIRVINLSVGSPVTESYHTDPLTQAAKRAVDAGIVVVAAAGNLGKNRDGLTQYGAITAPGNAPWVLTVGASNHQGTVWRYDDVMGSYSSRGPTAVDFSAKPDLVAPGSGIVSLSAPGSLFYTTKSSYLLTGSFGLGGVKPYLSLTGTSMAAPAVAGAVALMVQANPNLTPNLVKAVLQYTAQEYPAYNALTQGAGFLNARGAVTLARYFATAQPGQRYPQGLAWSRKIIWGNQHLGGGAISPSANAWNIGTTWGAAREEDGDNIVWGTDCETEDCDNIVWGTFQDGFNIVWGTADLSGFDEDGDNIVWGTREDGDNIVWGTAFNIVWGTDCGGEDCDNIVWGTSGTREDGDNIVWGTSEDGDNIVWGTACQGSAEDCDNIVWGTNGEDLDSIVWGSADNEAVLFDDPEAPPAETGSYNFEELFELGTETTASGDGAVTDGSTTVNPTNTVSSLTGIISGGL